MIQVIIGASIIMMILVFFIILFLLQYQKRQQENLSEKINMQSQFQQALLQTQIEIQEQTLKTISQEIHDNIGQVLSLAKLNLNTLQPGEEAKLIDTKNLVSKAINDLRDLSRSLHGDKIAELGLQDAVANELQILQNTGQYQTQFSFTGEPYKLQPQQEMVLFRMVQEAMNNSIKHAKAKKISIAMQYQPKVFILQITDDGIGFNSESLQAAQTGIGLKSMQNRAALIGGELKINSSPGNGTEINIELKR